MSLRPYAKVMRSRRHPKKFRPAPPAVLIAFAGLLTVVWMGLLIWLPLRLLQLI